MRGAIGLLVTLAVVSAAPAAGTQAPKTTTRVLRTAVAARAIQPGELVVVTITSSLPLDSVAVRAFGRDVPASSVRSQTWQALVGIDVDVRPASYTLRVDARADGREYSDTTALRVRARTFPTRRLKVDPSFVNPPSDVQPRIADEARVLAALWAAPAAERLWTDRFVPPTPGPSSSRFGALSIFNGEPRGRHTGEDFSGDEGTPIVAPNAGRVALARDLYFSGNTVVIDHGAGLFSLLAHLSAIDVKAAEVVTAGQQVGRLGATGRVTGPHLHWAVRLNGARIDPSSLLATLGSAFESGNR